MASINDYGQPSDLLSNPPLGGDNGWAAAVAAALDGDDTTVDTRIAAAGGGGGGVAGVIDVTADPYNATGDGTTDDSVAIRAALAAASVGDVVWFPAGTYIVSQDASNAWALDIPAGITLDGGGTIQLEDSQGANTRVLRVSTAGVTIRNITIDGNKAGHTADEQKHGIFCQGGTALLVQNVTIVNCCGDGVTFFNDSDDCTVDLCRILDCDRDGVTINPNGAGETATNIRVTNNYIDVAVQPLDSEPPNGATCSDIIVQGNTLITQSAEYALTISGSSASTSSQRWTVKDNHITGAVYLIHSNDVLIDANVIDASACTGITGAVRGFYQNDNVRFHNNTIYAASGDYCVDVAFSTTQPLNWSIKSNTLFTNGARGISAQGVLGMLSIAGNTIVGDNSNVEGIYLRTTQPMPHVAVQDNMIDGFGTGISLLSSGTNDYGLVIVTGNTVRNTLTTPTTTYGINLGCADVARMPIPPIVSGNQIGPEYSTPLRIYPTALLVEVGGNAVARQFSGTSTPESAVTAPTGSMFTRRDGGTGTTLYVKESGTGNTGWEAK